MDDQLGYRERDQPTGEVELGYNDFAEQIDRTAAGAIEET